MSVSKILISLLVFMVLSGFAQNQRDNTVAVLEFEGIGISKNEASILTQRFRSELVNTQAFIVIERGQMDEILNEMGFQQSGCTSSECMIEVGQILNVHHMIGGTVGKIGNVYTLDVRMIDVETSQILGSVSQDHEGDVSGLLQAIKLTAVQFANLASKPGPPAEPALKTGSVQIYSAPDDATVFLDGEEVGKTPYRVSNLKTGAYQVKILKNGYEAFEQSIVVKENELTTVRAGLIAMYRLSIDSEPQGATIFINDLEVGKTPFTRQVKEGTYQLRLVMQNYKVWQKRLALDDDESLEAELEFTEEYLSKMKPQEDESNLTWLYIAGGAVAIGVTAAVLLSSGDDEGTVTPATTNMPGPPNPPTD